MSHREEKKGEDGRLNFRKLTEQAMAEGVNTLKKRCLGKPQRKCSETYPTGRKGRTLRLRAPQVP